MADQLEDCRVKEITHEVLGLETTNVASLAGGFGPPKWIVTTAAGQRFLFKLVEGESKMRRVWRAVDIAVQGGVATPPILHGGVLPERPGAAFLIYEFWEGEDSAGLLAQLRGKDRREFFSSLGGEVAKMHLLLPEEPFDWRAIVAERLGVLVEKNRVAGILSFPEIDRAVLHLNSKLDRCGHVRAGLMHGDLYPANFLCRNSMFRAILDFDHTKFYDPFLDFVKLRMWTFTEAKEEEDFLCGYRRGGMELTDLDLRYDVCLGLELLAGLPYWKANGSTRLLNDYRARFAEWIGSGL